MEWQHRLSMGKNTLLQRAERHEKRVLAVLFFIMLLIAVLTVGRRSFGYDTLGEQKILDSNVKAYAQTLAGEGSAWYQSFPEYIEDIRQSVEKDHGQAALYLFWPVKYLLRNQPQSTVNSAFYLCDHLIFLYALYALYRLIKGMTGQMAFGLAAVLLLYCNPRFFAESFINSKDVVLMSLCLIVFWHGWRFIKQEDWLSPVLFGFFGALAFNLRLLGIGAFGVCGLAYLTDRTLKRAWSRRMVLRGALAVGALALFYYLLTPASWANPIEFLQYVYANTVHFDSSRWNGLILYRGDWFNPKRRPIPWHYIPWWMMITTPLLILVLAFLCPAAIGWKSRADHAALLSSETVFCFWLGLFGLLPVAASMVGHSNLYNGWRHLYFVYASIIVLASVSLAWLWNQKRRWLRGVLAAAVAANLIYYAGFIAVNYPNEYAYFNVLAGPHPEENYDADYWLFSCQEALEAIMKQDPHATVADMTQRNCVGLYWNQAAERIGGVAEDAKDYDWNARFHAAYLLQNTSYWKLETMTYQEDDNADEVTAWIAATANWTPLFEVKCGRTVLWKVYRNLLYIGPPTW